MKKIICLILVTAALITVSACGINRIELDDVKEEFITLVEASYEINEMFFGEGLPTYERGGEYDRQNQLYSENNTEFDYYEYVMPDSGYYFTDQIKWNAEKVYTEDYLNDIYTMAFDGYADENTGTVTTARYLDANGLLVKYVFGDSDPFDKLDGKKRRFDFESMKIVKPYSSNYVNVSIDSYLIGEENEILNITLHFKKTSDGWRLDAPTY